MKYQAIFSEETKPNQKLGNRSIFVISLTLNEEQVDLPDKNDKFVAGLERLSTVSDTLDIISTGILNRHNYEIIGYDVEEAKEKAISNETFWQHKHLNEIKALKNLNKITPWQTLVAQDDYKNCHLIISKLYETDHLFKMKVVQVCGDRINFLATECSKNPNGKGSNFDPIKALNKSIEYVLEECAITLLLRQLGYDSLFYLGKVSAPIYYVASLMTNEIDFPIIRIFSISQYKLITKKKLSTSVENFPKINSNSANVINNPKTLFTLPENAMQNDVMHSIAQSFFDSSAILPEQKVNAFLQLSFFYLNNKKADESNALAACINSVTNSQ